MKEFIVLTAIVVALGLTIVNGVHEPVRALVDGINSNLQGRPALDAKFVLAAE